MNTYTKTQGEGPSQSRQSQANSLECGGSPPPFDRVVTLQPSRTIALVTTSPVIVTLCKMIWGDTGAMGDENTKRAAEEYLATKLAEESQSHEDKLNREAAVTLAPQVWKRSAATVITKCNDWNAVTKEQSLTCKETVLGDLRISCAGRSQLMTVQYDSTKRLITIRNTARLQHGKDVVLRVEGYAADSGRDARLVRNDEIVNFDMLIVGELRVLAGLSRKTN
jgi:hypothetical protein